MKTLNERLVEIKEAIQNRANHVAELCLIVAREMEEKFSFDNELIPYACSSRQGYVGLEYWENIIYHSDKPNETVPLYNLIINEEVDHWDDMETETFSLHSIPADLIDNGTDEQLNEFFVKYFREKWERQEKQSNLSNYLPVLNLDFKIVEAIMDELKNRNLQSMNGVNLDYNTKRDILVKIGLDI